MNSPETQHASYDVTKYPDGGFADHAKIAYIIEPIIDKLKLDGKALIDAGELKASEFADYVRRTLRQLFSKYGVMGNWHAINQRAAYKIVEDALRGYDPTADGHTHQSGKAPLETRKDFVSTKPASITRSRVREMLQAIARNKTLSAIIIVAFVVLAAAFAYGLLISPTPYFIVHEKGQVFRVNRFTGVRQWSTENGWMTEAEMRAEQQANAEQQAARDRAKSKQVLNELKQITVEDDQRDLNTFTIYPKSGVKMVSQV